MTVTGADGTDTITGVETFAFADQTVFQLQILHLADGEAGLLAPDTAPYLAALVDRFDDQYANTLILAGGDNFIPGPFLAAGTDPSLNSVSSVGSTAFARPDIAIHNVLGVEVSALGNHDFDLGSAVLQGALTSSGAWSGAQFATVTANLDFANDSALRGLADASLGGTSTNDYAGDEASTLKGKIAPWVTVTEGGEKIGILGATTQLLNNISSPSGTAVKGKPGGDDIPLLASQLQPIIDQMIASGIDKIVLQAHLQTINNEKSLATLLSGVDVILAAGSNTRLGDDNDTAVAFPGHAANFADTYPIVTEGKDGKPVLIINTDNEYTYLGRLVVEFDENGEVIVDNLDTTVSGAYAATEDTVEEVYGAEIADAFADGSKGDAVQAITDAVQAVISAKDGTVHGYTEVYLEGERNFVRSEETNLGNLSADANIAFLKNAEPSAEFVASLKNGGGIRAQIGAISSVGGGYEKVPPLANPDVGKAEGGISQLDIENSLRFNNGLMAVDLTPAGLKAILEHAVAAGTLQGRFPQLGGVQFSFDLTKAVGSRVENVTLIDENGVAVAPVVVNGAVDAGAPAKITLITLNFLANGGDGYPFKANGENFRYLLNDGTLSAAVDEALDFTATGVVPANILGEQQALADYLGERYATEATAFDDVETPKALDTRIQNLASRADNVVQNLIDGTSGDDVVTGTALNDQVAGGHGDDLVTVGGGDTVIGGQGDDKVVGTVTGNDRIEIRFDGKAEDYGITTLDQTDLDFFNAMMAVDGANFGALDLLKPVFKVTDLMAVGGNDGTDRVQAQTLIFADRSYMVDGKGVLVLSSDADTFTGGIRSERVAGGVGHDTIKTEGGADFVRGDGGNDIIDGGKGADILSGGSGNDVIAGGSGNDILFDHEGGALMSGGAGADTLIAATGVAATILMEGGSGADIFGVIARTSAVDLALAVTLGDFSQNDGDKIDLSHLRDTDGSVLTFSDVMARITGENDAVIDLTGLKTEGGEDVTGNLMVNAMAAEDFAAGDFVFSGGFALPDLIVQNDML